MSGLFDIELARPGDTVECVRLVRKNGKRDVKGRCSDAALTIGKRYVVVRALRAVIPPFRLWSLIVEANDKGQLDRRYSARNFSVLLESSDDAAAREAMVLEERRQAKTTYDEAMTSKTWRRPLLLVPGAWVWDPMAGLSQRPAVAVAQAPIEPGKRRLKIPD